MMQQMAEIHTDYLKTLSWSSASWFSRSTYLPSSRIKCCRTEAFSSRSGHSKLNASSGMPDWTNLFPTLAAESIKPSETQTHYSNLLLCRQHLNNGFSHINSEFSYSYCTGWRKDKVQWIFPRNCSRNGQQPQKFFALITKTDGTQNYGLRYNPVYV